MGKRSHLGNDWGLTHPPLLFSQGTRNLRTNWPRLSTKMCTVVRWPCRTQSTARAPATAYMETTFPHVIPIVGKKERKKKKSVAPCVLVRNLFCYWIVRSWHPRGDDWFSELFRSDLHMTFFQKRVARSMHAQDWPLHSRKRWIECIWCGRLQTDINNKMVNGTFKSGKFCHNFLPRHSRDNKRPPAITVYSFQGGWGCDDRRWWSAGLNGISLLNPASNVMAVLESWAAVSAWGYKGKEIWASLNKISIRGSCQGTSHIASCWGAGQE